MKFIYKRLILSVLVIYISMTGIVFSQSDTLVIYKTDGTIYSNPLSNITRIDFPIVINTTMSKTQFCVSARIAVQYTISKSANSGNTFTAQLSDAGGSFANPVSIGTLNATGSGTMEGTIPVNTSPVSGYRIRVVSSNPVVIGSDNGTNITLFAQPVPVITALSSFCQKNIQKLNANTENGLKYKWFVSEGTIIGCDTCSTLNVQWLAKPSGIVSLIETNANGCSDSTTKSITLNPLPTLKITGQNVACTKSFSNFSIEKQNGHSYKWILTGNGVIQGRDNDNSITVTWGDVGSATLKFIETIDETGCSDSTTKDIVVNPLPKPEIVGNLIPCSTCLNSYSSKVPTGLNHIWEVQGGQIIDSSTSPTISVKWKEAGTGTIKLIQINPTTGCSDSISNNVVITAKPQVEITGLKDVCKNNLYSYSGVNEGSAKFEWFVTGGIIKNGSNTSQVDIIWDSTGSQTLKQIKTISSQGFKDSVTINVNVNDLPNTDFSGPETSLDGETKDYSSNAGNVDFQWYVENGSFEGSSNTSTFKVKWRNVGIGSIKLIVTDNNTKCKDSLSKQIKINSASGIIITGNLTPCENSTVQYSIEGKTGEEYIWSVLNGTIYGDNNFTKVEVQWSKSGSGTLTLIRTILADSKKDTVKLNVDIIAIPPKPSISRNQKKLVSTANVGNQWFLDNNLLKDSTNAVMYPSLKGNYQVQVTLNNCSSDKSEVYTFDPTSVEEFNLKNSFKIVPNPATNEVEITFTTTVNSNVKLKMYSLEGMEIVTILNEIRNAGTHTLKYDLSKLTSGIYSIVLESNNMIVVEKVVIVR